MNNTISSKDYIEQKLVDREKLRRVKSNQLKLSTYHRSIGALISFNAQGQKVKGTAFMISSNLIITAAHNVYNKVDNRDNKNFRFYQAANGIVSKYFQVQAWKYPVEYITAQADKKMDYDYALLKLIRSKQDIKKNRFCQLYLSCCICNIEQVQELQLDVYGYPFHESLPNFTPHNRQEDTIQIYQYGLTRSKRIVQYNPIMCQIKYKITTLPAQSGSPLHLAGSIIGIHLGSGSLKQKFNVGRLITSGVIQNLTLWCNLMKGQSFSMNNSSICCHHEKKIKVNQKIQSKQCGVQTVMNGEISKMENKTNKINNPQVNANEQKNNSIQKNLIEASLVLLKRGQQHLNQSQLSNSLYCFFQCLQIQYSLEGEQRIYIARTLSHIANVYRLQGNFSKVIDYYKRSIEIYQKYSVKNMEYWNVLNILGCAYFNKFQDYSSSASIFRKSLSIAEHLEDQQMIKFSTKWLIQNQNHLNEIKNKNTSFYEI